MPNWKYKRFKVNDQMNEKLFENVIIAIGIAWTPKGYQFHEYSGHCSKNDDTILYKIVYKRKGMKTRTIRL